MKKLTYNLLTRWRFDAPADRVWSLIYNAEALAGHWPGIRRFHILNIEEGLKAGCRIAVRVKSLPGDLDFMLEVTEVEPGRRLALVCSGDLQGEGHWMVEERDGATLSEFSWNVATTEWFMNILGLLLKPLLIRSHDRTMAHGYEVLSEWLKQPLVATQMSR
ncbi:SRPBCC family protein [Dehalogenimonas sp. THU2]|uniref:SRPBCC family protein n=1 Tax=Dehalogenimonas sp. THU2 TaxID=3151121 RepID=UPI0032189D04